MKKILLLILLIVFLCFLIPILFTKKNRPREPFLFNSMEEENNNVSTKYDYGEYNKVKLLHNSTQEVEEIELDEYLYGVVSSEMPASFEPEALKAQAVVARTYTIYKIKKDSKHENANICDDSKCCQSWISKDERLAKWNEQEAQENWQKIVDAIDTTKGEIITYEGEPINALFHANSGGITDIASNVWGGNNYPYLQSVQTSGEDGYNQYKSEVSLTKEDFILKIKEYHNDFNIDFAKQNQMEILEYTDGERVKTIRIGNLNLSGTEIRNIFGLKSAKFEVNIEEHNIKFNVIGYGHGVGMSQTGADSMAKQGKNYKEIVNHFYTNVQITNI